MQLVSVAKFSENLMSLDWQCDETVINFSKFKPKKSFDIYFSDDNK